ncbi:RNA polymerase sigma-70 factor [Bacteroides sp. 519]|uniref:RNA polymerase sigma-70 factor n=1 Tax=Bacteroides sp. 519 TaxID=2302937 RepID=UPI0013D50690|nr:RNA polymerase sigma-70 factor [Bacteroides sp. 519]NDV57210.1 RNA polymerase sigma-70 factor [Bacteroides sp. 519]
MIETEISKLLYKLKESGSQLVFREFYNLCYDRFYRIAYFYAKNEEWSQEIVLEAFTKLWEKRNTLTEIASIEDYCFILVKNIALNYLAKESRNDTVLFEDGMEKASTQSSPEETMISEELFTVYLKALNQLPERCREVFVRIKEEKQSYAQVAEQMGISTKTVDAQLQKALKTIREVLASYL